MPQQLDQLRDFFFLLHVDDVTLTTCPSSPNHTRLSHERTDTKVSYCFRSARKDVGRRGIWPSLIVERYEILHLWPRLRIHRPDEKF